MKGLILLSVLGLLTFNSYASYESDNRLEKLKACLESQDVEIQNTSEKILALATEAYIKSHEAGKRIRERGMTRNFLSGLYTIGVLIKEGITNDDEGHLDPESYTTALYKQNAYSERAGVLSHLDRDLIDLGVDISDAIDLINFEAEDVEAIKKSVSQIQQRVVTLNREAQKFGVHLKNKKCSLN